ncbi:hypothetical protein GTA51_18505 [Desulfovibrio aerotolerans]|uniref:Uncharacterized protein n=1 Tax=Solidesulfovibrio aerotolerans TaxID=295255 RepID=A0A7C9IN52_9BACT|nr:hypothetical protein [Solidesulfovibrio aerotolerans]MYL85101.1 hypothetical protein [Solidesulfovibrio aerotolerans]
MSGKMLEVMGSKAGYSLMMGTLDNIREVAPTTAFERGDAIDLIYAGARTARSSTQPFASGIGSLTDTKA